MLDSEKRSVPGRSVTASIAIESFIWSQYGDGLDYRFLNTSPPRPCAERKDLETIIDSLGQIIVPALPYEGWMWFTFPPSP